MRLYSPLPPCDRKLAFHKRGVVETVIGECQCLTDEEGDLLYALVRMLKPTTVVETGTYQFDSGTVIGRALYKNGLGSLHTCDINPDYVRHAEARAVADGLPVVAHQCRGEELIGMYAPHAVDFLFIDSGSPDVREAELRFALTHDVVRPGGLLVTHDALVDYTNLYEVMVGTGWPHLIFDSQVGIAVYQRPRG